MMRIPRILSLVLGVQLVLVAVTWWPGDGGATRARPLFDLERDAILEIEIASPPADGESDPVVLAREGDGWTVRSAGGYPATPDRVDSLLDTLLGLTTTVPIATQAASHEALKVSDDDYGRRLRVVAGGESTEWLIGAASNRSINMRRLGEDDVYLVRGASEWSFQDRASSYYDAAYVDADVSAMNAVAVHNEHGDLRFEKGDAGWVLVGLIEGESADAEKAAGFLSAIAKLRMSEPVGREALPEYGLSRSVSEASSGGLRVDWTLVAEDQSVSGGYRVGVAVEGDRYVKAVDQPFVVRVGQRSLGRLQDAQRSDFLK